MGCRAGFRNDRSEVNMGAMNVETYQNQSMSHSAGVAHKHYDNQNAVRKTLGSNLAQAGMDQTVVDHMLIKAEHPAAYKLPNFFETTHPVYKDWTFCSGSFQEFLRDHGQCDLETKMPDNSEQASEQQESEQEDDDVSGVVGHKWKCWEATCDAEFLYLGDLGYPCQPCPRRQEQSFYFHV
jgi:hypothetical protein